MFAAARFEPAIPNIFGIAPRLRPDEAAAAVARGAALVDIRSDLDRERDGIVPGSLHIPRTVLEWRLAADSAWRNPFAPDVDKQVILMCDHGCSSVLAAAPLVGLGFARRRATSSAATPPGARPRSSPPRPHALSLIHI